MPATPCADASDLNPPPRTIEHRGALRGVHRNAALLHDGTSGGFRNGTCWSNTGPWGKGAGALAHGEVENDPWRAVAARAVLGAAEPPLAGAGAASVRAALGGMWRAARLAKNVPLAFLVIAGAFTAPRWPGPGLLVTSLAILLVSSAFMTHLNNLTDVELDRVRKPQLWRWMSADPRVTVGVLGLELGVVLGGIGVLALVAPAGAAGLAAFTLLTTLYSYNFFRPRQGVARRLKAHWLGHFVVCVGGYLSLWVVGHASGGGASIESLLPWLPAFFFVSLSEYSLFLAESAIDAREERALGLATFARRLGRHGSSVLALLVWLVAVLGLLAHGLTLDADGRERVLFAFGPALLARGVVDLLLALRLEQDDVLRARLPDCTFWASRLLTAVTLAILAA